MFYVNVARLMGILPRPRLKVKNPLDEDRAETLQELGIIKEGFRAC